jgi:hypothetical protein
MKRNRIADAFGVTPEKIAECEALRASFVPQEPVWTDTGLSWSADFGDYSAGIFPLGAGWYYAVGRKIVNEWFGAGARHVSYGTEESFEAAKARVAQIVTEGISSWTSAQTLGIL